MESFPNLINPDNSAIININDSTFSIGRSLSCNHIIQSLGVSRFHCILKKTEDKWWLFDRSTNGTFVNTNLVKFNESVELKEGDMIKLGSENIKLQFSFKPNLEVIEVTDELIKEFEEPLEAPPQLPPDKTETVENELTCSICSELFIKAVTLNCSHSFCSTCIGEWRKSKSTCPICRKQITSSAPTLVLDNLIEKFMESQSDSIKAARNSVMEERKNMDSGVIEIAPIEITSDDDEDDSDYDDYDYDLDDCWDDDRGAYFGGYGRCYICNAEGHWANGCPLRY